MVTADPFRLMVAVNSCRDLAAAELYGKAVRDDDTLALLPLVSVAVHSCRLVEPTCTQLTMASRDRSKY